MIEKYVKVTECSWRKTKLLDVWEVDRSGEVITLLCVYVSVRVCVCMRLCVCVRACACVRAHV